jgi:predicted double-glycine peptidase
MRMPGLCVGALLALLLAVEQQSQAFSPDQGWLDVPFVRQVKYGCGPAAVAMVMQYWAREQHGLDVAPAERINQALPASSQKGLAGRTLKQYLEEHGFEAYIFNGELQDLSQHLAKGRPVIVCLGPKGPREPLHYTVVVGIDEEAVLLNDPARGKMVRENRERFVTAWKATGQWSMLAIPRRP